MSTPIVLPSLTIANGQTESNVLSLDSGVAQFVQALAIQGPGTLPEAITVHVAEKTGGTFGVLQKDGADVAVTVGDVTVIWPVAFGALKLVAGVAVGAARTFLVSGRETDV